MINTANKLKKRHRVIQTEPGGKSGTPDRYILCRWELIYGCMVEASGNDLPELLMEIPDFLTEGEDETLCVCEVMSWREDPSDMEMEPHEIETLYEVQHRSDPTEEEDNTLDNIGELTLRFNQERDRYEGLMRGDVPAGFDVTEGTRRDLSDMQRAALRKMGETANSLAEEIGKV